MRLKIFLVLISAVAIGNFNSSTSFALGPVDCTSEHYLIDHGHSPELVRMINLQKDRTEGKAVALSKPHGKIVKFLKNLWFEQDATLPLTDFGYNEVKSPEASKSTIPPTVDLIKSKYDQIRNDKKDSNEIDIKNVNVR